LTLSEAREKAGLLRNAAKAGMDPVIERDRERLSIPKCCDEGTAGTDAAWRCPPPR
jgi:hypothetical protein